HSFCSTGYDILDNTSLILPPPEDTPIYRSVDVDLDERGRLHRRFITFIPKIAAVYDLDSGIGNIYATVGKGYKAGGFNTQMFSDVLQQRLMTLMGIGSRYDVDEIVGYRPEKCWSTEIGTHLYFASHHLSVDASLFYIDITDQQLTRFPEGSITGRIMTNAGKTRSLGGELSIAWNPVEPLSFNLAYGFTDARFVTYNDGVSDFAGKHLPYAPGNTLWTQCVYTLRSPLLRDLALIFDANVRGAGKIYWNEANTRSQHFYLLPGASVTLAARNWSVRIWGSNLSNTRYSTFYFLSMGNEFLQRGNSLSAGITLRLSLAG
ncbi:MAG: TonB-dependent receptor, partial [Muribaculaceae bacterium]|nr:TonB-dependent receptor [Muribaculaceae bacterium]